MDDSVYVARIAAIHQELNIPPNYGEEHGIELQFEPDELVIVGMDTFGRPQRLSQETAVRWRTMHRAALGDDVQLLLVSAFRSVEYQQDLIERKLSKGQTIEQILQVNAAPGYSEHHTGRALDLATPGCEPLTEAFEETAAFDWLTHNADHFSFRLSYPRNNPFGVIYEPWHWTLWK